MKRINWLFTAGGLNLILLVIGVNLLVGVLPKMKLDLTSEKIFTLSITTRETVKNLDDIVGIKVYVSKDLPGQVRPVAKNLKAILNEVARINPGRWRVSYLDPSQSGDIKAEAEREGIQPLQFNVLKGDKFEISSGYLGLVMSYGSKKEVLPVAGDVGNLEYFLVSSIKKLTGEKQMIVAVSEETGGGMSQYQILRKFMEQMYRIEEVGIGGSQPIGPETKVWLVLGDNVKLEARARERLKNWVEAKKGLVVLEDRFEVGGNMAAVAIPTTGMEEILKLAGITVEPVLVVDENSSVASFQTGSGNFLTRYLFWPQILEENIDRSLPPLSSIGSLTLAWASPIKIEGGAKAILRTSQQSMEESGAGNLSPINQGLPEGERRQLVVGAVNMTDKRVAVIGDADWLKDQFIGNNQQNLVAALNMIDYLGAEEGLMQIRSKVIKSYPIGNLPEQTKTIIKTVNLALPLMVLAVIGMVVYIGRKTNNHES